MWIISFREYLYKAVSNSETVIGEMLSQLHMACPIRDPEGFSRAVMDINLGTNNSPTGGFQLNKLEKIDLARMLKIQQDAFHYMSEEAQGKTTTVLGEFFSFNQFWKLWYLNSDFKLKR